MVHVDDHGFIFKALIYFAMFTTVFLLTFLKPHRLYKNIISNFFNINFTCKGANLKVYNVLTLIIFFFSVLLAFLQMQSNVYISESKTENFDRKMFRLSQKWLIESEMWLTFLIIIELTTIYKMAVLNDKKNKIAKDLNLSADEMKKLENNY